MAAEKVKFTPHNYLLFLYKSIHYLYKDEKIAEEQKIMYLESNLFQNGPDHFLASSIRHVTQPIKPQPPYM